MLGSNEINGCCICRNNMQLVLFYYQNNAKYMETKKKSKKAIVISTVIATNCTHSYKSYRMYQSHLHSLRWQLFVIVRLWLHLLALEFGTLTYLAFWNIAYATLMWMPPLDVTSECNAIIAVLFCSLFSIHGM